MMNPLQTASESDAPGSDRDSEMIDLRKSGTNLSQRTPTESFIRRTTDLSPSHLVRKEFYQNSDWLRLAFEIVFRIEERGSTIQAEVYHGVVHFISCFYCLAVVPDQYSQVGYESLPLITAICLVAGFGSILSGFLSNLPFVMAAPTPLSIYIRSFLLQHEVLLRSANFALMFSGAVLLLFVYKPLAVFVRNLIPSSIQVGTAIGIGILVSLAGATEIEFVVPGENSIVQAGHITMEIVIAMLGACLIAVLSKFHTKGAFCIGLVFCSIVYWAYTSSFPTAIASIPEIVTADLSSQNLEDSRLLPLLTIDLTLLYIIYLNGLIFSLSNLAGLLKEDGSTPGEYWVYILSGIATIISGWLTSAPVLISPESAAAIKDGAKTGLSAIVAGILFLLAQFFAPLLSKIPSAGTSPVLIMIGLVLFQNCGRIYWKNLAESAPAFMVLFFIPWTFSIITGVILGYLMYVGIGIFTGEAIENSLQLLLVYFPQLEEPLLKYPRLFPFLIGKYSAYRSRNDSNDNNNDRSAGRNAVEEFVIHRNTMFSGSHVSVTGGAFQRSSTFSVGRRSFPGPNATSSEEPTAAGMKTDDESALHLAEQERASAASERSGTFRDWLGSFTSPRISVDDVRQSLREQRIARRSLLLHDSISDTDIHGIGVDSKTRCKIWNQRVSLERKSIVGTIEESPSTEDGTSTSADAI